MKLRPFELILALGFGIMAIIAMILMATYQPRSKATPTLVTGTVVVWGVVDRQAIYAVLEPLAREDISFRNVSYVQKSPDTIDSELITALADGVGPDVIILPHEKLIQYRPRLQPFTYNEFPLPDFKNLYIDGAEIYAMSDGVYALPVVVDPIILYSNRDILSTYNFTNPPTTWEGLVNEYIPTLVQRNFNREIIRSPLAFGEFRNVQNAFPVVSTLLLQRGSLLVTEGIAGRYEIRLNQTRDGDSTALARAIEFYTNFANPSNALYSWNRSLPLDRNAFVSEDLVFYFGRASEARGIAQQNPNLNFTTSEVPQGANASIKRTYGTFYGLAMLRSSQNKYGARVVMQVLSSDKAQSILAESTGMAPVSRLLIAQGSNDRFGRVAYTSSLYSRGWWSPSLQQTESVFQQAIEDVLANRARPSGAANDIIDRLSNVY
jgi:ABC-type glycerol-3-phosphate transport system substrate-binding protein